MKKNSKIQVNFLILFPKLKSIIFTQKMKIVQHWSCDQNLGTKKGVGQENLLKFKHTITSV
jgi:hypothetical protein